MYACLNCVVNIFNQFARVTEEVAPITESMAGTHLAERLGELRPSVTIEPMGVEQVTVNPGEQLGPG